MVKGYRCWYDNWTNNGLCMESPTTQSSLIVRLQDANDASAWRDFVTLYAPLVYRYVRSKGLQEADAADVSQEILSAVAVSIENYQRRHDRAFRPWLLRISHNKVCDFFRRSRRQLDVVAPLEDVAALTADDHALWDLEWRRQLFRWIADQIETEFTAKTWQAFWRTAVLGEAPRDAADALELSVGAVYVARSRVMARLRLRAQELDDREVADEFSNGDADNER